MLSQRAEIIGGMVPFFFLNLEIQEMLLRVYDAKKHIHTLLHVLLKHSYSG